MPRRLLGVAVAASLGACSGEGAIHETSAGPDTLDAIETARIGELDGAPEYLLGDVAAVAADRAGHIYIADQFGSTLRVYDGSGAYMRTIASQGEGPGELSFPRDLVFDPQGRLHVRDAFRVTSFAPRTGASVADSLVGTRPLGGLGSPPGMRGSSDGHGYYYPAYLYQGFERQGYFYIGLDSLGVTLDTLHVPPLRDAASTGRANHALDDRTGLTVDGVNIAPFEPVESWFLTNDRTLYFAPGDRYDIVVIRAADTLRVIHVDSDPRPVPPAEHADSLRAFGVRYDSIPVPVDQMRAMSEAARTAALPEVLPEVLALFVSSDSTIWVRRWPREGSHTYFDVLSPRGVELATVRLPVSLLSDPQPWVVDGIVVGVVADPVTEVEQVVAYRVSDAWRVDDIAR